MTVTSPAGSNKYSVSWTYIDTLPTVHLCDSVIETKLVVHPSLNKTICQESVRENMLKWEPRDILQQETILILLRTEYSCDSVIHTMLIVNPILRTIESKKYVEEILSWPAAVFYRATGNYVDTLSTIHSCDSIVTTKLFVDTVESELRVDSIFCFDRQFGGVEIKVLEGVPSFSIFWVQKNSIRQRTSNDNLGPEIYRLHQRFIGMYR